MKKIFTLLTLTLIIFSSCAQNRPAPEYLINKTFPDSIQAFKIQNVKGESVSLKEILKQHEGKKIVLDFWASWCGDCIKGLPKLKELQSKTTNIDYVFFSLDKTKERWEKSIIKLDIKGDHYFMAEGWKNTLTNYIGLDWIPRYMILDENGTVIYAKAVDAADKEFRALLIK